MAVALLDMAAGKKISVESSELSRLRSKVIELQQAEQQARLLRSWMSARADRSVFLVALNDLAELRADERIMPSGISHSLSGMAAGDIVEGYVRRRKIKQLISDHFLAPGAHNRREANVVLHASDHQFQISRLLIAADLADYPGSREHAQAARLIHEMDLAPFRTTRSRLLK